MHQRHWCAVIPGETNEKYDWRQQPHLFGWDETPSKTLADTLKIASLPVVAGTLVFSQASVKAQNV